MNWGTFLWYQYHLTLIIAICAIMQQLSSTFCHHYLFLFLFHIPFQPHSCPIFSLYLLKLMIYPHSIPFSAPQWAQKYFMSFCWSIVKQWQWLFLLIFRGENNFHNFSYSCWLQCRYFLCFFPATLLESWGRLSDCLSMMTSWSACQQLDLI